MNVTTSTEPNSILTTAGNAAMNAFTNCRFIRRPQDKVFCGIIPESTNCIFCKPLLEREFAMLNQHLNDSVNAEFEEKFHKAKAEMVSQMVEDLKKKKLQSTLR